MLPTPIFLIGYCATSIGGSPVWNHKHQPCLIFTVRDQGASDWIGSSKIILLIPHLSNIGTNSRLRPSQGLRYALPQSLPGANGAQCRPQYHLVCGLIAVFSADGGEEVCTFVCECVLVCECTFVRIKMRPFKDGGNRYYKNLYVPNFSAAVMINYAQAPRRRYASSNRSPPPPGGIK